MKFLAFASILSLLMAEAKEYEYIVIGAGSAGSIVAAELADSGSDVLIIEAGGDEFNPFIEDLQQFFNVAFNTSNFGFLQWGYSTTVQEMAGAADPVPREFNLPQGKVLGGTDSINAAAYVQANAEDFDSIARELGDGSWAWQKTKNLRTQLERTLGLVELGEDQLGAPEFIQAAHDSLGFPLNRNPLNGDQYGISPSFWSGRETPSGGQRRSSFDAFVLPLLKEPASSNQGSIDIATFHQVERLIFDPSDNTRVIGVECLDTRAGNIPTEFFASREVIVSAGTYNSPKILLHSGIGPEDHLREVDIEPRVHLPGVGANLRDHYSVATFWNLVGLPVDTPFLFQSPSLNIFGPETRGQTSFQLEISGNFGLCTPLRQDSVGTVRLQSNDTFVAPLIDPNVLSTTDDIDRLVDCLENYLLPFFGELMNKGLVSTGNLDPNTTGQDLRNFVVDNVASAHHPVGTCKVGADDDDTAVLDKDFKVRGFSNLRVIDASVFPKVPSGNTNAPTMTVAKLGARKVIREKAMIV